MSLKNKLLNRKNVYGTWININNILIPEILSQANFDWFCIDLEHSGIDYNDVVNLIISSENSKCTPLVRVPENNESIIKRVMDIGASGVIVPNIKNASEALKAVNAIKYHPKGNRGVGLFRAQKYGTKFKKYFQENNKNSIAILQIEHIEAVNNIEEIGNIKGIDCFFVGPYDLTSSMGIPGEFDNDKYKKVLKKILEYCKYSKKSVGIHSVSTDYKNAVKYKKMGFNVIGMSIDTIMLRDMAINIMSKIK
tara:strand:+ start:488 stop:1240 length:753 start_codon:yes stop_codon:yes gene_type:complete